MIRRTPERWAELVRKYPDDLDAATLYAEALMDLRPWNYWKQPTGEPYPGTTEIVAQLERVHARESEPPGRVPLLHPCGRSRARREGGRLRRAAGGLMPGDGHMVHMPAHIYIRVGRYADAIKSNVHAVHTDETYIEDQRPLASTHSPTTRTTCTSSPLHRRWLATASWPSTPPRGSGEDRSPCRPPGTDGAVVRPFLDSHAVTFGRWEEVLKHRCRPPIFRTRAHGSLRARRRLGREREEAGAEAELVEVQALAAAATANDKPVFDIAVHALMGEIAARKGSLTSRISHFQEAKQTEDGILYFEPPTWYYPIRHSLGAVLLQAGRAEEAETAYREDLKRFPENGWALFGLMQALRAEGKAAEALTVGERFRKAWASADVTLTASRF